MSNFIHLHVHTVESLLDGYCKMNDLVDKCKEYGMNSIAITDHGTLAGTYAFNKTCRDNNIKPILGCEVYWTHDRKMISKDIDERKNTAWNNYLLEHPMEDDEIKKLKKKEREELAKPFMYDTKGYHLILLAKNQTGWNNLVKLTSMANDEATYNGRGHIDNELLKQYGEGLICTTACISGIVPHSLRNNNEDYAIEQLTELKNIFGDDLYLEIQPLDWAEQYHANRELMSLSQELNIELVATNDVHYTRESDDYEHDVLLCIGTNKLYNDPNRMRYAHEYWLRTEEEMISAFERNEYSDYENDLIKCAMLNTIVIADKINDDIQVGSKHELLPDVEVPEGYRPDTWLKRQCWTNLYKYLLENDLWDKRTIYEKRLKEELSVIISKGFDTYMLIVQEMIKNGEENGFSFGPGRGSAAGCLVAFLLGIVKGTDPIEYDLLFFRFLTITRTANPDIDSDISRVDRQNFLQMLDNKYGHNKVSLVGTSTTLKVKNGIKDVMRVLDYSFTESNNVSKQLDEIYDAPDLSFEVLDGLKETDEAGYKKFVALEKQYAEVFALARTFEGISRNTGIHAGGVIVTPNEINDTFPTKTVDGKKVSVWEKDTAEKAGSVKIDMLGLATISVIDLCLKFIKENHDIDLSLLDLYDNRDIRNDKNTFKMISEGKTECVFQLESNLFKGMCKDIKPDSINDIIAITSLGRPGPLQAGMDKSYARRKHGEEPIVYPLGCESILKDTYGTIVYQEQIMLMAKEVAGFDDNQADTYLRKGLAKKKRQLIDLCKQWFIYGKPEEDEYGSPIEGGMSRGYDEKEMLDFWDDLEGYASYLFNKSHATSYSLLSCITAWLKYYFTEEYFAAHLEYLTDKKKIPMYAEVMKRDYDITLTSPNINESWVTYAPYKKKIVYGMGSIKGVGEKAIDTIIKARPYETVEDFINKVNEYDKQNKDKKTVNKTAIKNLIKAGAFDFVELNRNKSLNQAYDMRKDKDERLDVNNYNFLVCMEYESEVLSVMLTHRPWFDTIEDGYVKIPECEVVSVQQKKDRKGRLMAFVKIIVDVNEIEVIVFSSSYIKYDNLFDNRFGNKISIEGEKKDGKIIFKKGERR